VPLPSLQKSTIANQQSSILAVEPYHGAIPLGCIQSPDPGSAQKTAMAADVLLQSMIDSICRPL
jgi:hypothetical protein